MPLMHDAEETRRKFDDELRLQKVLRVAKGHLPDAVAHVKLFPLDRIIIPLPDDPGFARAQTEYLKLQTQNNEKQAMVDAVTRSCWTTLASGLAIAAETNRPSLAR